MMIDILHPLKIINKNGIEYILYPESITILENTKDMNERVSIVGTLVPMELVPRNTEPEKEIDRELMI